MPLPDTASNPAPETRVAGNSPAGRWLWAVAALLLCVYAAFIATHMGAYAGGSDSSGYMNSAKLFAHGAISMPQRTIAGLDDSSFPPRFHVPLGFEAAANHRMVPTYSTGLPLAMNAVAWVTGWRLAPHVTIFLFSLAGLLFTGWMAREWGLTSGWALLAVLLMACCPLYLMYSMHLMSDMPAMVFATATLVFAWKSRERAAWAVPAGLALAGAVLTRHTNALLLPALAICMGFRWRNWLLFAFSGLPGGVFYCLYNHANYGHYFQTGYEGVGDLLKLSYVPKTLYLYAWGLPALLTPFVVFLLGIPWLVRSDPRRILALIAWIVCLLGFYSFYSFTHETLWYLRFILPAFPALVIGSLLALRAAWRTQRARLEKSVQQTFPPVIILVWAVMIPAAFYIHHVNKYEPKHLRLSLTLVPVLAIAAVHLLQHRFKANPAVALRSTGAALAVGIICVSDLIWYEHEGWLYIARGEAVYPHACEWANKNLPANSVIYTMQTSGALLCYTTFTLVRWDFIPEGKQAEIEKACAANGQPIYGMFFPEEVEKMQGYHFLDRWTKINTMLPVTFWRLDKPGGPGTTKP